jgi:3-oxoacyl-[acyl-carrier-protein] synthase-3
VLGPAGEGQGHLLSTHLYAEGKYASKLWLEAPASICHPRISEEMLREGRHYPKMDGRFVFKQAVERFQEVIHEALSVNHLDLNVLNLLILHQANLRIVEAVIQALNLPIEKTFTNIENYGNTTAASIPIASQ